MKIIAFYNNNTENQVRDDYNEVIEKDFYVHADCGVVQEDNEENSVKDANIEANMNKGNTSDETDSDIESIKCVFCNNSYNSLGVHRCKVTCTIENDNPNSTGSDETLVAEDMESQYFSANSTVAQDELNICVVSCVLCDQKYDKYDDYVEHINKCTANVKLHYFVCPLCHELNTDKNAYLQHLNVMHFKQAVSEVVEVSRDCVDNIVEKTQINKSARRQIGWSFEDIYQEIGQNKVDDKIQTSSPIKSFFTKLGNE